MKTLLIFKIWTHGLSATVGLLVVVIVLFWPALPLKSFDIWFQTLINKSPTNILYPFFALLVGSYAALYIYDRKVTKCCRVDTTKASAAPSLLGILFGACPACIPAIAIFLPLSITIAIGYYSSLILLASIGLIVFSLWRAGGFQKV